MTENETQTNPNPCPDTPTGYHGWHFSHKEYQEARFEKPRGTYYVFGQNIWNIWQCHCGASKDTEVKVFQRPEGYFEHGLELPRRVEL